MNTVGGNWGGGVGGKEKNSSSDISGDYTAVILDSSSTKPIPSNGLVWLIRKSWFCSGRCPKDRNDLCHEDLSYTYIYIP